MKKSKLLGVETIEVRNGSLLIPPPTYSNRNWKPAELKIPTEEEIFQDMRKIYFESFGHNGLGSDGALFLQAYARYEHQKLKAFAEVILGIKSQYPEFVSTKRPRGERKINKRLL